SIEVFRGRVLRVATGVDKDDIRVKIENLQARPVECKAGQIESRGRGHDVEMVGVIGRDLDDLLRFPEWTQAGNQRHLVAASVLQAEKAIEREQRRIVIKTVCTQPFGLRREGERG